jgi:hypothetical protein
MDLPMGLSYLPEDSLWINQAQLKEIEREEDINKLNFV